MTIKVLSNYPKQIKYNMAKMYGISNKGRCLNIDTGRFRNLCITFDYIGTVKPLDGDVVWDGGYGLGAVRQVIDMVVKNYYKAIEMDMWGDDMSKKIRGKKGNIDIYLNREDMIIE